MIPDLLRNQADLPKEYFFLLSKHYVKRAKHRIHKEPPYLCSLQVLYIIHQDQSMVCDKGVQAIHFFVLLHEPLSPLAIHRQKVHSPENRFLHIYQNKTEQYPILSNQKIFLRDALPHKHQNFYDKTSPSALCQKQESSASEHPDPR